MKGKYYYHFFQLCRYPNNIDMQMALKQCIWEKTLAMLTTNDLDLDFDDQMELVEGMGSHLMRFYENDSKEKTMDWSENESEDLNEE